MAVCVSVASENISQSVHENDNLKLYPKMYLKDKY